MARIKKIYKEDFTVVATSMYRDKRLTLKDRGLLGTMLSLPEDWDFSIVGLASILDDGERAVRSSLKHLEEVGYLRRKRLYKDGKVYDWEYEFSDYPLENINYPNDDEYNNKNLDGQNVHVGNVHVQKERQLNIYKENIKEENINNNIVDDNKVNVTSLSDKLKQKENEIKSLNESYDIFSDEEFLDLEDDNSKHLMSEFNATHKKTKTKSLYKFSDVALNWLRYSDAYGNSDIVVKAEKALSKVLDSFKNKKERLSICEINKDDLNDLFEICIKYYDSNTQTNIQDINAYIATVVREKIYVDRKDSVAKLQK